MSKAQTAPAWPHFEADEIEAACRVLRSGRVNYWTGDEGRAFESEFAARLGARHAIAVANGTLALEFALRSCGVGPGDEVILPARTFVATASAILMVGGTPVFADVDRSSGNLSAEYCEPLITRRTRAVIPVHVAGWPCELDALAELARDRKTVLIEDCAQALGAKFRGRHAGMWGEVGCFSFCQDKILTTGGEGGMLTTDSAELWERLWSVKDHGKSRSAVSQGARAPGFRWLHEHPGTNGRLTEMQSALGRVALGKLPERLNRRRRHAEILSERLSALRGLTVPRPPQHLHHVFYRLYAYVLPERLRSGWDRDRILATLDQRGFPAFSGTCCEVYRERVFRDAGLGPRERLPNARWLSENSMMFDVHHRLRREDLMDLADAVEDVMKEAVG